jgi:hypothetical protein
MHRLIINSPRVSLILIAFCCALLWRLEVEYHGWSGLTWLGYTHYAVPTGFIVFLFWANLFIHLTLKKRIFMNCIALIFGMLLYFALKLSLTFLFAGGPSGMLLAMQMPKWQFNILIYLNLILIPFLPIGAYLILLMFKRQPAFKNLLFSLTGVILSIPLSLYILSAIHHKGGADCIHVIKSGVLIPFWVFFIGWMVIYPKKDISKAA